MGEKVEGGKAEREGDERKNEGEDGSSPPRRDYVNSHFAQPRYSVNFLIDVYHFPNAEPLQYTVFSSTSSTCFANYIKFQKLYLDEEQHVGEAVKVGHLIF